MNFIILSVISGVAVVAWGLCLSKVFCPFRSANTTEGTSNDEGSAKHEPTTDQPQPAAH
jgi:hypothetical protein